MCLNLKADTLGDVVGRVLDDLALLWWRHRADSA